MLRVILSISLLYFTIREFLIVIGMYKGPLLRQFERYGEQAKYSPILNLSILLIVFVPVLLILLAESAITFLLLVILFIPSMHLYRYLRHQVWRFPGIMFAYPVWCHELVNRATREERRRVAYMWLRLPYRTRLTYNASDQRFYQWVDQVLVTIT